MIQVLVTHSDGLAQRNQPIVTALLDRMPHTACHRTCQCGSSLDGLVSSCTGIVLGAVGKKPVNDQAEYREEENAQAPEQLVGCGTVRLEEFGYVGQCQ